MKPWMRMMTIMIVLGSAVWFVVHWESIQAERERYLVSVFELKWAGSNYQVHSGGTYQALAKCMELAVKIRDIPSMHAYCERIIGSCYGNSCATRRP